jgi:VWFA-related protein
MSFSSRTLLATLLVSATIHGQTPSGQTPSGQTPPGQTPPGPTPSGQVGASRQPPAQRAQEAEATEVTAIVVDVIVRDRNGNPVRGLTKEDFGILEDGVMQEIGSFTPINTPEPPPSTPATRAPAAAPASAAPAAPAKPEVIALVFDRLSGEARSLANKAALTYVGSGKLANNIVAVFGVDLSLSLIQQFTRDGDLIRKGIEAAGGRATSQFANTRAEQQQLQARAAASGAQMQSLGGGPGAQSANAGAVGDAEFAAMQADILESFQSLERDQQGYATSNSLLAIVSALKAIPGRKSVVFFSEGLSIPPNVQSQFVSVIDAANRANVSIYPMDAAGLRTESTLKESRGGITAAGQRSVERDPTADPTGRPMMMALEQNEALLRADPHSGLGTLADETGGFLIANTNDLRGGFSAIETDMRNYYALTYTPTNTRFDGRFRRIDVKVKRSDVRVRSRKGYFAVRPSAGAPVLSYEAPALAVLEQSPVPNAFPTRALALRFPERARPGLVPVLVNVPTAGMTFRPSEDKKSYTSDFVVLVRFRDEAGQTIEKMSQRYQLQGAIDQLSRATQGEVLFYRQPDLVPGVYSMEVAVYDAFSSKASVRLSTVEVPETAPSTLAMSSVVAIKRSEKVPEPERGDGPLFVGDQLLYPNMGEPVSRELPFYFVVYPVANAGDARATLELLGNGQQLAQAPLELAKPDSAGRIRQVSRIPIETLKPGSYELRITVEQGAQRTSRQLVFRIAS